MNLVIHAHTLKNEPLSQPITGRFDERGGTIGRSDTNTLSLPDPERHISRLHAEVWFSNGVFSIRNVGSANAIIVNGRPIAPGEGTALADGDEISVGAYAMRATIGEPSQLRPAERSAVDGRTVIKSSAGEHKTAPPQSIRSAPPATQPLSDLTQSPGGVAADPFADLFGAPAAGAAGSDPFADLLGGPASPPPSSLRPTPVAGAKRPATPPAAAPHPASPTPPPPAAAVPAYEAPPARLPDDFDPFADVSPPPSASAGLGSFMGNDTSPRPAADAPPAANLDFADLLGSPAASRSSSLDDIFGLGPGAGHQPGADPLADFLAPPKAGPAAGGSPKENPDPLAMFGSAAPPPPPPLPPDFDRTPELKGAYTPPAVQTGAARPAPPAASSRPAAPPNTSRAVPPRPDPGPRPERGPIAPGSEPPFTRGTRSISHLAETTMPAVRVNRPIPSDDVTSSPLSRVPMPPASPPPSAAQTVRAPAPAPSRPPASAVPVPAPLPPPRSTMGAAAPAAGPAAPGQHSNEALWAAFCEGAGINMTLPQGLNPDLMRVIGQVLKHSVDGTLKLVQVRAAAKSELRAQVTTIQSRNNNPLKFSPDSAAAIEQLLQPPMRGFMVGPDAVTDVMDDLLGHAIGTMAGMRAALAGVLQRFEPSQLESKLSGSSMMDAVLPMNRRAKLWELYLQHFKRIEGDAEEDFHELFGKAFIRAYEDQLDRLDSARHPNV